MNPGTYTALIMPLLALAITGFVLALVSRRRLGGAAATMLAIGSATFLVQQLLSLWWVAFFIPNIASMRARGSLSFNDLSRLSALINMVAIGLIGISFGLIIFAAFIRRPADKAAAGAPVFVPQAAGLVPSPYPQPGYPPPATHPQAGPAGYPAPGPAGYPPRAPGPAGESPGSAGEAPGPAGESPTPPTPPPSAFEAPR